MFLLEGLSERGRQVLGKRSHYDDFALKALSESARTGGHERCDEGDARTGSRGHATSSLTAKRRQYAQLMPAECNAQATAARSKMSETGTSRSRRNGQKGLRSCAASG